MSLRFDICALDGEALEPLPAAALILGGLLLLTCP